MVGYPYGEPVTRIRAPIATDRYGNQIRDWARAERATMGRWGVAPRTSTEPREAGRDAVITGLTLYGPPGVDVLPSDRLEVRGHVWEVEGEPQVWISPLTGWAAGVVVDVRRAEG